MHAHPSSPGSRTQTQTEIQTQLSIFLDNNKYSACFLLSDINTYSLHGTPIEQCLERKKIPFFSYQIHGGETSKTISTAASCWQQMYEHRLDRSSLVIGLGGGAVTDLAGFVSSCYMRGIDSLYIPTTLLGMVDASIGGKTGVNLPTGKNIIGTIYPPKKIITSPDFLKTLPERDFKSGLAEVIKSAVIASPTLFNYLESHMDSILKNSSEHLSHIIVETIGIKNVIVEQDQKENGPRMFLNYGHTFGHAIEAATGYRTLLHGEAVSIGMHCAANAACLLGLVDDTFVNRQAHLCLKAGLPIYLPPPLDCLHLIELMRRDKKSTNGTITLILPEAIGKVKKISDVNPTLILSALKKSMDVQS